MDSTIQLITSHRSIRAFKDQSISPETLNTLIHAGKSAPSSSFIQCTSVIRITDPALREKLTEYCSQQTHIRSAAEFLVFCIDFNRHAQIAPDGKFGFIEQLLTGSIDVTLFAQNLSLAAESLGIGTVYIGAIRNRPLEICELLKLPHHTFPLFGLCLGYPAETPEVKPRLPHSILVHENHYTQLNDPVMQEQLKDYDAELLHYFQTRTKNSKADTWSASVHHKLSKEARPFLQECLNHQGFAKQ